MSARAAYISRVRVGVSARAAYIHQAHASCRHTQDSRRRRRACKHSGANKHKQCKEILCHPSTKNARTHTVSEHVLSTKNTRTHTVFGSRAASSADIQQGCTMGRHLDQANCHPRRQQHQTEQDVAAHTDILLSKISSPFRKPPVCVCVSISALGHSRVYYATASYVDAAIEKLHTLFRETGGLGI